MSGTSYQLLEEHLWCCICLEVFTDPVTLPCGHNFCKSCMEEHLRTNRQRQCPMCKDPVDKKHKLRVNTFISALAAQYRLSAGLQASSRSQQVLVTPLEPSDPPAENKHKSLKPLLLVVFILTCLILFFGNLLRFHQTLSGWELLPLESSEGVCTEHGQPLELHCKNDDRSICQSCRAAGHRNHRVVPVRDEYDEKKAELQKTEAWIQQVIWQRRLKIQELERSLKLNKESADQEMADGVQMFSSLIQNLEWAQAELIGLIEEKQRAAETRVRGVLSELEQEVSQLMRRRLQLQKLSRHKEPVLFLQSLQVLDAVSPTPDRTQVKFFPVVYKGLTRTVMVGAVNRLTESVRDAMQALQDSELNNIPRFGVDVTLDPDTAHPALVLSDDGKRVHCGAVQNRLTYDPKRFETALYVLGKQGFSCGRFHFDVRVKGKTAWTLGVASESVNKKSEVDLNPENGYWAVRLQNRKDYVALEKKAAPLPVRRSPETVRVLVDYEEGQVLFYDVDAAVLLHSFTGCSFTETLRPFFGPGPNDGGRNAAPLILSSVNERGSN